MRNRIGQRRKLRRSRKLNRHIGPRRWRYLPELEALEARVVLAPLITSRDPGPNSQDEPISTDISIVFDETINAGTVSDQTVAIFGDLSGKFLEPTNQIDTSDNTITYSPGFGIQFQPGELVHVTLTSGVQNPGGQAISPIVWQFRARASEGSGFFTDSGQSIGSGTTVSVALGDLDADTDLDAFVSTGTGTQVYVNNGGTFSLGQSLAGGAGSKVLLGDVDGDGDLDAVAGRVFLNQFRESGTLTFNAGQNAVGGDLGDVDADGDLDILGVNILVNNGFGTFTTGQAIGGSGKLGDVDNDGDLDAFITKVGQGNQVWLNNGSGGFSNSGQSLGLASSVEVELGDLDDDGDLDALVGNDGGQGDRVWFNDGLGNFSLGPAFGSASTRDLKLGDIDSDGDLDALITSSSTHVWFNNGTGFFTEATQILNGASGRAVDLGDINKDGSLDAFLGNVTGDKVWLNQDTVPLGSDRFEPNDTAGSARSLDTSPFHLGNQLFQIHEGLTLDEPNDIDFFRYTTASDGPMSIQAIFVHALGDIDLRVTNLSTGESFQSNSNTDNEIVNLSRAQVSSGNVLLIEVDGFAGGIHPDYDLVIQGSAEPADQFEGPRGNDSDDDATILGPQSQTLSNLTIHNAKDRDFFEITAIQNGNIDVNALFSHSSGDLDLQILEQNGRDIKDASESSTDNESVSFFGVIGQRYFIRVFGFEGASNRYSLTIGGAGGGTPPTISNIPDQSILEDNSTKSIGFTVNDTDTDPGSLKVTGSSSDPTLIPNESIFFGGSGTNRTVMASPVTNRSGAAQITVAVSDNTGGVKTETFTVTVGAVADPPNLTVANANGNEGAAIPLNINASLKDTDGSENLTIFIAGVPSGGLSAGTPTGGGNWQLTPAELPGLTVTAGANNFTLTVTARATEFSNSDTANTSRSLAVSVTPINKPVTVSNIPNQTIKEDTSTGELSFTVDDPDGPESSLILSATSSNTNIIPAAGITLGGSGMNRTISVTPAPNLFGAPVTITVSVFDGVNTTKAAFSVKVDPVNDVPTVSSIADRIIDEGTTTGTIPFTIGDVEVSPDQLVVSAVSDNQTLIPNGNLVLGGTDASRTIRVTPVPTRSGSANIMVNVNDGTHVATESFRVTVNPLNANPTITPIADQTINEDNATGALGFTIGDPDTPIANITLTAASDNQILIPNSNLVIGGTGANRTITVTPAANLSGGPVIVTITANDGIGMTAETFSVTVNPVNDVPTVSNIPNQSTQSGTQIGPIAFTVNDVEDGPNNLVINGTSSNQAIVPNANIAVGGTGANRSLTITPLANQTGPVDITVRVTDSNAGLTTRTFQLNVVPTMTNPTISNIADVTIPEDGSTGELAFTVGDAETPTNQLALSASSSNSALIPPQNIVFGGSGANRTVRATPLPDQSGSAVISVTVTDTDGGTATDMFAVTVDAVPDAPRVTSPIGTITVNENAPDTLIDLFLVFSDADPNGGPTFSIPDAGDTSLVAASVAGHTLTLDYLPNQAGTTSVVVRATDPTGLFAEDTVTVVVNDVNMAPAITSSSAVNVLEGTTSVTTVTATDPNGDTLRFSLVGGADASSFAINSTTGALTFTSPKDFENPNDANGDNVYVVEVQASDGALTARQVLNVTVTNRVEDPPTVMISEVTPSSRAASVGEVEFVFSKPVRGFEIGDLMLTRTTNGTARLLPGSSATLTTTDNITWRLGNLSGLTGSTGIYRVSLAAATSGITDLDGNALLNGGTVRWINGAGDANLDNAFDQFDVIFVLQGGRYLTGLPANFSQGDFNGDGVFDQNDIIAALQPAHYLRGAFLALSTPSLEVAAAGTSRSGELPDGLTDGTVTDVALESLGGDSISDNGNEVSGSTIHSGQDGDSLIDMVMAKGDSDSPADAYEITYI